MQRTLDFIVRGQEALFTDPATRLGGEKCTYQVPTYEALKGVAKSIYWKPTFNWVVESCRVMNPIRMHNKGMKPLGSIAIYTLLTRVEYQVRVRLEWNEHRPELEADRNLAKHMAMAHRSLKAGGRQDIFLGMRDCQGYAEPCTFGEGEGALDGTGLVSFGLMFHGFDYPDETGTREMHRRLWRASMQDGVIHFPTPAQCEPQLRQFIRKMKPKQFGLQRNVQAVSDTANECGVAA